MKSVCGFRQIEQLLDAVHQAAAGDAAGADRDERLDDLEAVAERIVPGIEERQQPLAAVRSAMTSIAISGSIVSAAPAT